MMQIPSFEIHHSAIENKVVWPADARNKGEKVLLSVVNVARYFLFNLFGFFMVEGEFNL